jgi:hypothetical protein
MINQLLLPGHVEKVAGFAGFRSAMESLVGPQSPQALASRIFGLYSGFVYFTPMQLLGPETIQLQPPPQFASQPAVAIRPRSLQLHQCVIAMFLLILDPPVAAQKHAPLQHARILPACLEGRSPLQVRSEMFY